MAMTPSIYLYSFEYVIAIMDVLEKVCGLRCFVYVPIPPCHLNISPSLCPKQIKTKPNNKTHNAIITHILNNKLNTNKLFP